MFAYYFPPLGGGGVQRTLKYVKYLPSEGFASIVVAGSSRGYSLRDASLRRDIPEGTVVAHARAVPFQQAQWKLDGALRRLGLPTRLLNDALWPDGLVGWLPAAVWHGLRAARRHRLDVIYSTSSPTTAHLAALIVHRITGLPWVADFRDPWTLNPVGGGSHSTRFARASAALERSVVAEASYISVVDESVEVRGLASDDPRRVVIHNGVDPDDLGHGLATDVAPSSERFRLSHVGSMYDTRDAAPVFDAMRDLIGTGKLDPDSFELRIVGHANLNRTAVDSMPVTFTGYVDHDCAVAEMGQASALLLYQPAASHGSSAKIYEYLSSGQPVLCVANPDNLGYRLVEELGGGVCADPRNIAGVSSAIERMVGDWEHGRLTVDPNVREQVLQRFSRRTLAAQLARTLRAAIAEAQRTA